MSQKVIKIESIKKLKRQGFYSLITDLETITITDDVIVKYALTKDLELSIDEFEEIKKYNDKNNYFIKVCNFIYYQMRSISEVKDYLKKYQVNDNDIIDILNRLENLKLVDDNMLANLILESTINNHKGPNIFIQKVKQRKLDININEFVYEKDIEEEVIDKVIKKYLDNNRELPVKKQKEKIYTKLLRDGFSNDLISKCINKVTFVDNSYLSLEKDINKALFKYRNLDLKEKKEKVLSNLMRKGYSYSQIVSKINSIDYQD